MAYVAAPLGGILFQTLTDLHFDLSKSFSVKCHVAAGLPVYDFPLVSNSNHVSIFHVYLS